VKKGGRWAGLKCTAVTSDQAAAAARFVRRTALHAGEYRKNFRQVDADVIAAVTSREADAVTPLMSKIYLRLVNAPPRYWEREGVLRFEAESRGEAHVKAWGALCELVGVASATASKALRWMHGEGIVGYFAGKNGVGIRVFINRAASSIGSRGGKKILEFNRASSRGARASAGEAGFNDSYAELEVLEKDLSPGAPKNGAENLKVIENSLRHQQTRAELDSQDAGVPTDASRHVTLGVEVSLDEIVSRLSRELEPSLKAAARRAAAQEHERTREWLESRGLPKAARVAQHEAYNVLRKHGVINEPAHRYVPDTEVVRNAQAQPRPITQDDINDLAGACIALLETKGQSVELTLSEMSAEGGGFLLPEDAARVRARADSLRAEGG
jgi:hypothetical protein